MRRNPVSGLAVFVAVAQRGSFGIAARELGVRPSAVSQQIRELEKHLGVSLFARTTRKVRLTEAGERLLMRGKPALAEIIDAVEEVQGLSDAPAGTLRITLPEVALRMALHATIGGFLRAYPRITLDLSVDDGFVDIIAEGFHAGIRPGHHVHRDMIAVRLTPPLRDAFFASPSYLAKYGRPKTPADLVKHNCILYRFIASKRLEEWRFRERKREFTIQVKPCLIVNDTAYLIDAARDGLGIASFYRQAVESVVKRGELELLLEEYCVEYPGFYLYFPKSFQRLRRLRALVDWLNGNHSGRRQNDRQSD